MCILKGGGGPQSFGVVFIQKLEVLAILKGEGAKCFHPLKGGRTPKFYPVWRGAGGKQFWTCDFPIL